MLLSLQAVLPLLDLCDFFYASVPAHTHYNVMLLSAPRVSYTGAIQICNLLLLANGQLNLQGLKRRFLGCDLSLRFEQAVPEQHV